MLRRRSISSTGRGTTRPYGGCLDTAISRRRSASTAACRPCRPPSSSESSSASRSNSSRQLTHEADLHDRITTRSRQRKRKSPLAAAGSLAGGRSQCLERGLPACCAPQAREVRPAISSRSRATTMLGTTAASWIFSTAAACSDQMRPAAANVTPDNVDAYIAELKERAGSMTVHGSICKLRRAAQFIAPGSRLHLARRDRQGPRTGDAAALEVRPHGHDRGSRRSWADLDPRGRKLSKPDRACPSMSGSQWADGGVARFVSHPTEELRRLGDRPQLCGNPRHMVDRAFGLGDEGKPRRRAARRRAAHACH